MAEIRQSKVNKTLILSTRHICSVTPNMFAHMHVLGHFVTFIIETYMLNYNIHAFIVKLPAWNFFPSRSTISLNSLERWRSAIGYFSPVVGCKLNVNARTCKNDVTRFISFVPVWLFHFVSGSFTDAVHSKSMYSGQTISYVNCMK